MRIVFLGTPEFAVPALDAVAAVHEIVLVVAQPDRPAGRGMKMQKPPVAARAAGLGLAIAQPAKIRDEGFLRQIASLAPDAGVVIAYGKILPAVLLAIPKHGFFNVHASVLPKYRGAAPIQRAIEAGETMTGATIMRVDEELDHGPILATATIDIGPHDRLPVVSRRLAEVGAIALVAALAAVEREAGIDTPQDHTQATYAAKIEREEGRITFQEPGRVIYNRFRAFDPWPGIFFESAGETIKVAEMSFDPSATAPPRTITAIDAAVHVGTAEGVVRLVRLQRPGKPRAAAGDIARGLGWRAGERIP